MAQKAIQLYTLREMDGSFSELLERVASAGFDGVEYAYRVVDADPAMVSETLERTGLAVPSAHVPIDQLEADLEGTVQRYRDRQCERVVVPSLDVDTFESAESAREAAHRLDGLADQLVDYDYPLFYHNHQFEFTDLDGQSAFDVFAAASDAFGFELDVGLASWAGVDPAALLERYGDRIELVHCTDTDRSATEATHVSFGAGDVDFESLFGNIESTGVDWLVYENGSKDDPSDELEHARQTFLEP